LSADPCWSVQCNDSLAKVESNWDARRISWETTNYWNYETNAIDNL